jgi:DNA-binding beta-propeller fold protein YncE
MNTNRAIRSALIALAAAASLLSATGCGSGPAKVAANSSTRYAFWPLAPDEPRIQFLGAFNSSEDISPTKASGLEQVVFGKEAVKPAYVNKPYGIASRDGKIYICDIRAKALVVMDLAKKQTRLIGTTGQSRLERPIAVAAAPDGQLYVADGIHAAIVVYDKNERFSRFIPIPKLKPASIAINGNRLYVVDMGRQSVLMLDAATGKQIGEFGSVGDEEGQFRLPVGVSIDKQGNVYVSDMMRCKVQKFSAEGKYIASVGEQGDHAGGFARPKQLAVDEEGIIYVVDAAFQNVQMFNAEMKLLMHFGAAGEFPGAMNLPVGIAVTDSGIKYFADRLHPGFGAKRLVIVANQFGDSKISVYALGERRSDYSLADLSAAAAKVETGTGAPSAESLKFQNIGGVEPGAEGAPAIPPAGESPTAPTPSPAPAPVTPKP